MGEYVCNDGKPVTISFVTLLQGPTNGDARDVRVDCSAEHLNPQPTTGYRRVSGVSYPAPVEVRKVRIQEMNHPTQVMNLCDVSVKGYETPIKVTSEILRSPQDLLFPQDGQPRFGPLHGPGDRRLEQGRQQPLGLRDRQASGLHFGHHPDVHDLARQDLLLFLPLMTSSVVA